LQFVIFGANVTRRNWGVGFLHCDCSCRRTERISAPVVHKQLHTLGRVRLASVEKCVSALIVRRFRIGTIL